MRVLLFMLLFPALAFGQSENDAFIKTSTVQRFDLYSQSSLTGDKFSTRSLQTFVVELEKKRADYASDKQFVKYLFTRTHRQFLRHFSATAAFSALTLNGEYNCLTGTALYGLLLNHFEIPNRIIETNYHIFLLVDLPGGELLLEATDPQNGFMDNAKAIAARVAGYRKNTIRNENDRDQYYRFDFDMYNEVGQDQVVGLMHYNHAIDAYNNHHYAVAIAHLAKAMEIYPSERMNDFSGVLMLTVMEDQAMAYAVKENCIRKLQWMRQNMGPGPVSAKSK